MDVRRVVGASGEDAVAAFYEAAGYRVVDRNWRVREGELDLVVTRDRVVVFCEVKTRRGDRFGTPFEAVTARKQQRLRALALRWLDAHESVWVRELRFDVAAVTPGPDGWVVDLLEAAF